MKVHKENQLSKWNCKKSEANDWQQMFWRSSLCEPAPLAKEHLHLAHAIFLYAEVDLLVEGDEVGQAAANSAWYFYVKVVLVSNGILFFLLLHNTCSLETC